MTNGFSLPVTGLIGTMLLTGLTGTTLVCCSVSEAGVDPSPRGTTLVTSVAFELVHVLHRLTIILGTCRTDRAALTKGLIKPFLGRFSTDGFAIGAPSHPSLRSPPLPSKKFC